MNEDFIVEVWSIAVHRLEKRQQGDSKPAVHLRRLLENLRASLDLKPEFILDTMELDRMASNQSDGIDQYLERLERCLDRALDLPARELQDPS